MYTKIGEEWLTHKAAATKGLISKRSGGPADPVDQITQAEVSAICSFLDLRVPVVLGPDPYFMNSQNKDTRQQLLELGLLVPMVSEPRQTLCSCNNGYRYCSYCLGSGMCSECKGDGQVYCCGDHECPDCYGEGQVDCPTCGGMEPICELCQGEGKLPCEICDGGGRKNWRLLCHVLKDVDDWFYVTLWLGLMDPTQQNMWELIRPSLHYKCDQLSGVRELAASGEIQEWYNNMIANQRNVFP